jgi:hypothetical protein
MRSQPFSTALVYSLSTFCCPFDQLFDRPNTVAGSAGHRCRLALQRLMLTGEIIPRQEERLHSRVVTQALAVAVG